MRPGWKQPAQQRSLVWYFRRLQSMPLAEIPHRAKEACLRYIGRFSFIARRDGRLPSRLSAGNLPTLPLNTDKLKADLSQRDELQLQQDVDRLCSQHLELLGQKWPDDASCDWSLDPQSREHWSWRKYTFDIPRRSGQGPGDVKFVWELSRLQHLQVLALGAFLLGRDDARVLCLEHLDAWLRDNPPYQGLAYACGIELASRVISILFIVTFLGSNSIPESLAERIWTALAVHGRWIARFPSLFSSANNHLVAESAALFVLGSVAPELPESDRWKAVGWARLARESERQILSDGTGAEQSPTYLAYTMEWLLLSRVVHSSVQHTERTDIDDALRRGALFISRISDVRGNTPFFGDCDDGVVLRPGMKDDNYLGSIVTAIAAVLQSGEIIHPAFRPDLRTHLLAGHPVPDLTLKLQSSLFNEGGYTVLRSNDEFGEAFLMFDHGPLGFAQTAGHGHADALAIWFHLDGRPLLVDFGTYRYNGDAGWRDWARSTAAHNSIELNGQSQSEMTGPFNWGKRAKGELIEHDLGGLAQFCRASHDGYAGSHGVTHERQVETGGTALVVISDKLSGEGIHSVALSYHFSPQAKVESLGGSAFEVGFDDNLKADIEFECPGMVCEITRQVGDLKPGPGAVSSAYNKLQPAYSIIVTGQIELPYSCRVTFRRSRFGQSQRRRD